MGGRSAYPGGADAAPDEDTDRRRRGRARRVRVSGVPLSEGALLAGAQPTVLAALAKPAGAAEHPRARESDHGWASASDGADRAGGSGDQSGRARVGGLLSGWQ